MNDLSGGGLKEFLRARQPLETHGAEQPGLLDFERAAFIDQLLVFLLQRLQLIAREGAPDRGGKRSGQQDGNGAECGDGRPALFTVLRSRSG